MAIDPSSPPARSAPGTTRSLELGAVSILLLCCMIWGLGLVMVKLANAGIAPVFNAALRSVFAGVILLIWALARGVPLFERDRTLGAGIWIGIVFAIEFIALYTGLQWTSVARGTIFLHAAPFVAAVGEHLLGQARLSSLRIAGLVLAFVGLGVALFDGLIASGGTLTGDLLCLAAGIAWGATTVIVKGSRLRMARAEKTLLYQLGVSAIVLLAWSRLTGEAQTVSRDLAVLAPFAYTVLFTVVFGYTIWFWMMRTYSAGSLHAFTFLTPIFGAIAGHLLLNEPLSAGVLVGLGLVASGIWLVNRH
jgi:drug/metabolite transporter (DMT)-like permease